MIYTKTLVTLYKIRNDNIYKVAINIIFVRDDILKSNVDKLAKVYSVVLFPRYSGKEHNFKLKTLID